MEKISVVIPAYNSAAYLKEALDSVVSQTYPVFEVIVIDDGSTDSAKDIVKKYGSTIRYIYQDNQGPAAARNRGIKESKGDFTAFLDSDDLWTPEKLKKQMALFEIKNYGMVYCDISHVVDGKTIYRSYLKERKYRFTGSGNLFHKLLQENFIFTPTVIIKREVINKSGCFDEKYKICEDYKMWLKVAKNYEIGFVDEPLVIRRRHQENITQDRLLYIQSGVGLFKELAGDVSDAGTKRIVKNELGRRLFELGYYYWERSEMSNARENFIAATHNKNAMKAMPYLLASYLPERFICSTRGLKKCLR